MPHSLVSVSLDDFVVSRPPFMEESHPFSTHWPQPAGWPFALKHFSHEHEKLSLLIISSPSIQLLLSHYSTANYACVEL